MKIQDKGIFIRLKMNKKIIMSLILTICLVIPIVVAQLEYDNIRGNLIIDETTSLYGKINIYDWFGLQDLASVELKENTNTCGNSCSAELEILLLQDSILIDDVT